MKTAILTRVFAAAALLVAPLASAQVHAQEDSFEAAFDAHFGTTVRAPAAVTSAAVVSVPRSQPFPSGLANDAEAYIIYALPGLVAETKT